MIGSNNVDSVTQDIVYEIYAKNVGNVRLDNFNVTDDLGALFGAANVSNVNVWFLQIPATWCSILHLMALTMLKCLMITR